MNATATERERAVAALVHATCLRTLIEHFEQASSDGLCAEGAWEVAVDALRGLDLDRLLSSREPAAYPRDGWAG